MLEQFVNRHIGPSEKDFQQMLKTIGVESVEELISQVMPQSIRLRKPLALDEPMTEAQFAAHIRSLAERNQTLRSFIGMGYYPTAVPAVISSELPDYDCVADGYGDCQLLALGRGYCCRRGYAYDVCFAQSRPAESGRKCALCG